MAEIIDFAEIQAERRRNRARAPERESLERAIEILKANLASVSQLLLDAPREQETELLCRIDRFTAMIRYALRMLGHPDDPSVDEHRTNEAHR